MIEVRYIDLQMVCGENGRQFSGHLASCRSRSQFESNRIFLNCVILSSWFRPAVSYGSQFPRFGQSSSRNWVYSPRYHSNSQSSCFLIRKAFLFPDSQGFPVPDSQGLSSFIISMSRLTYKLHMT